MKAADAEHFMPNGRQRLGLSTECRECMNARLRRDKQKRYLDQAHDPTRTVQIRERKELALRGLRRCSSCLRVQPATTEYFNRSRRGLDGLESRCRDCMKAKHRARSASHPGYVGPKRARQRELYDHWRAQGCIVCGIKIPAVIDPHHVDPSAKEWNVGAKLGKVGDDELEAELEKCVPVCRTHHQLIEHEVQHGSAGLSFDELLALIRKKYAIPARPARGNDDI